MQYTLTIVSREIHTCLFFSVVCRNFVDAHRRSGSHMLINLLEKYSCYCPNFLLARKAVDGVLRHLTVEIYWPARGIKTGAYSASENHPLSKRNEV